MSVSGSFRAAMNISIAAIATALVAIFVSTYDIQEEIIDKESEYAPQTREIHLFTMVDENIDEEALEIPPDQFSQSSIIANKGDTVRIHFYNLEPVETQEHHTFTINDPSYNIDEDINAGESTVIEFKAAKSGIFDYVCTYHQPTMSGQLVVLEE
jgi:plastocyanin